MSNAQPNFNIQPLSESLLSVLYTTVFTVNALEDFTQLG